MTKPVPNRGAKMKPPLMTVRKAIPFALLSSERVKEVSSMTSCCKSC
jgi:hypothetical protein